MQLLKALVIGMGVLIVLAIGLLAYGLLTKTKSPPDLLETATFEDILLSGNTGCRIERATPADQRLILELGSASEGVPDPGCERVIVIDLNTGTVIGGISLQP